MLSELMKKKKGEKELDPLHKEAKMAAVHQMRNMASDMMKDDLGKHMDGMKKVTVAAPSKEDLLAGLEKAKETLGDGEGDEGDEDETEGHEAAPQHLESAEGSETPSEEISEVEDMDMTLPEIEEMERILQEKKSHLLSK